MNTAFDIPRKREKLGFGSQLNIITGRAERVTVYALLLIMAVLFAFPLYSAIQKSLEVGGLGNYVKVFTEPLASVPIAATYVNSIVIGVIHAIVVIVVSTTAGYAFSKLRWRGRDFGYAAVLLFLAMPGVAILVPVYRITQTLGLYNNYLGVGLAEAAITIPFGVLLMRNYARNIPDTMMEAASIDGAGHFRAFWSIFLPLSRPAIVNLAVLCMIWSIQDFLWPSFLFTKPELTTAALAVQRYSTALGRGAEELGIYNASLVLLAVPALLFVLFGLRFIVNGLTAGATKD